MAIAAMTLCLPLSVLAVDLGGTNLGTAGINAGINTTGTEGSLAGIIGSLIGIVLSTLGVLLFIYFVYAGFLWMTAQGDPKQVDKAKAIMRNSVMGLLITLAANSLVFFIASRVPGGTLIWTQSTSDVEDAAGLTGTNLFVEDTIGQLINVVLNVLGVILLLLFLYAGFLWMTAQGDPKQTQKAKDIMRNAAIGLVITLLSRTIANFVIDGLVKAKVAYHPEETIHSTLHT